MKIETLVEKQLFRIIKTNENEDVYINHYLFTDSYESSLISFPNSVQTSDFIELIEKKINTHSIKYIILPSINLLDINRLSEFMKTIDNGFIITSLHHKKIIETYNDSLEVKTIESLNYTLKLNDYSTFQFITTPFIESVGDFMIYHNTTSHLFSNKLFSFYGQNASSEAIMNYAEHHYPSSDFIKPVLKAIKPFSLKKVFPYYGNPFGQKLYNDLFHQTLRTHFYNSSYLVKSVGAKKRTYNYIALCEQSIESLEIIASSSEIINTFKNTKVSIDHKSLQIKDTELKGRKLWDYFFQTIYTKHGEAWIIHLETFFKKINRLYNINPPAIFRTIMNKTKQQLKHQIEHAESLKSEILRINTALDETTDKMLRDNITGLYNESFFKSFMLGNDKETCLLNDSKTGIFYISIDSLASINKRFGQEVGNDTLKTIAYILEQNIDDDEIVFKYTGAMFIVYAPKESEASLKEKARTLRNAIIESEYLIEKPELSIAIVSCDETNKEKPFSIQLETIIDLGNSRIHYAKKTGKNQIIDKKTSLNEITEGYILLIDEDEVNQTLIKTFFARENYQVLIANDVNEAFEILENNPIDGIISEINLSKLDGFALKQKLNQHHSFHKIPFIIVSHNKTATTIKRANQNNVDYILEKPIYPVELIGLIERYKQAV